MSKKSGVDEVRKQIEKVTMQIFDLCGERLQLTKHLGEIKARKGIPIENLKIEHELRDKVLMQCKRQGLDENFCSKLLQLLLEDSKRVQREIAKSQ